MADPNELFVITSISRSGIADDLNEHLDYNEAATTDRLAPDDARLTAQICSDYAASVGVLVALDTDDEQLESVAELIEQTLIRIGIDPTPRPEEDDEE